MRNLAVAVLAAVVLSACGDRTMEPILEGIGLENRVPERARFVKAKSNDDFDTTLDRLYGAVDRRDLTVFAVIDHQAGARNAGLDMRPATVVIFGSPLLGTPLMQAEPQMAAELPLRAAVYEDENGDVMVTVSAVEGLERVYDKLTPEGDRLKQIASNLTKLLNETAGADG